MRAEDFELKVRDFEPMGLELEVTEEVLLDSSLKPPSAQFADEIAKSRELALGKAVPFLRRFPSMCLVEVVGPFDAKTLTLRVNWTLVPRDQAPPGSQAFTAPPGEAPPCPPSM